MIKIQYFLIKNDECGNNMKKSIAQKVEILEQVRGWLVAGIAPKNTVICDKLENTNLFNEFIENRSEYVKNMRKIEHISKY